jgi:acetate---CoA ligase (ADP-forming)
VISVDTLDQLAAALLVFSTCGPAPAGGLASLHDSGGEREMVVDLAATAGVPFADISNETSERLRAHLDSGLQPANPLDIWGSGRDFETHVEAAMDAMLADPATAVGALFQDVRDGSYIAEGFARALVRSSRKTKKPVVIVSNYASVNHRALALSTTEAGVPVIDGTQEGLNAIGNLLAFRDRKGSAAVARFRVSDAVRERWRARLTEGRPFSDLEGLSLLREYGIRAQRAMASSSLNDVVRIARDIGFPLALKTAEPGIQHKSDIDGVHLNIAGQDALEAAYRTMAARLGPKVLLMEMAPKGVELALGLVRDRQLGAYVVAAAGGIWIELLKDRAVRMPPFGIGEAEAMIQKLRIAPLLDGKRGMEPCDRGSLYEALARFSMLAADLGDLIDEMDVNPLIVAPDGCFAVDALLVPRLSAQGELLKEDNDGFRIQPA